MVLPFLPRYIEFEVAGPEGDEELSGKILRLIQTGLATPSVEKLGKIGKIEFFPANHTN